jgi:L-asparaginase
MMANQSKLLMLTTGGTIAGNVARPSEALGNGAAPTDGLAATTAIQQPGDIVSTAPEPFYERLLVDALASTAHHLKDDWNVAVEIDPQCIDDVDSSDIVPKHWMELSKAIYDGYDDYDGFIVTHGTNTLGYTCAALSFALDNLGKPVVMTGSQVPYGLPGSDALINLENALRVALYPHGTRVRGVVCVFGSHIIAGTRVKKSTEFDLDAFAPFSGSSLGRIGRTIELNEANLIRHHKYLERSGSPAAVLQRELELKPNFDTRILSFTEFPGMSDEVFRTGLEGLIERDEPLIRALMFRAFGAGDASRHLRPCFEYLKEREVPVVVMTQAPSGTANFRVNRPGKELGDLKLAIPAHDMSIEAATTKLAWLLAQDVGYAQMGRAMEDDLHGEISLSGLAV